MRDKPPVVAVINSSYELVELLKVSLEQAGLLVVTLLSHQIRDGSVNLDAFMRVHNPEVIVYDIAPPYASDWALLEHIRSFDALQRCRYVLTSPNVAQVRALVGRDERVYEIIGKPHDIGEFVGAVLQAVNARPRPERVLRSSSE
jgi:DNA-binding NtrC family response regulator